MIYKCRTIRHIEKILPRALYHQIECMPVFYHKCLEPVVQEVFLPQNSIYIFEQQFSHSLSKDSHRTWHQLPQQLYDHSYDTSFQRQHFSPIADILGFYLKLKIWDLIPTLDKIFRSAAMITPSSVRIPIIKPALLLACIAYSICIASHALNICNKLQRSRSRYGYSHLMYSTIRTKRSGPWIVSMRHVLCWLEKGFCPIQTRYWLREGSDDS